MKNYLNFANSGRNGRRINDVLYKRIRGNLERVPKK